MKKSQTKKNTKKKRNKRREEVVKRTLVIVLSCITVTLLAMLIVIYLRELDKRANRIENDTDSSIIKVNTDKSDNNLYRIDVYDELNKFFEKSDSKTVAYKIDGETFYLDILKMYDENLKKDTYSVIKIVDKTRGINARINFDNLRVIEYMTGSSLGSTVINLISSDENSYFVIAKSNYYILGDDIETISYLDNNFYYMYYNKKYKVIETVGNCEEEVRSSVSEFNFDDTYYNYGRINFMNDYYQKLSSNSYSVRDKCDDMTKNVESSIEGTENTDH